MTTRPGLVAYLDCSTGVSGDKFLGALLDAGSANGAFTARHLESLLEQLAPEARVTVRRVTSHGISAIGVGVEAAEQPAHRRWRDIREALRAARLADTVRGRSEEVFEALAHAEAAAHGCAVDDVHFHEVGALDSILDVVGVCAGLEALGIESLTASPVATGWGTVDTSHGVLPVPAPATAALLIGVPTVPGPARRDGSSPGELTTPTGAALLRTLASAIGVCPPLTPRTVGYGAGTRDIGAPNICQLVIGDPDPRTVPVRPERVTLLESNVDHLSPEALAVAAEQLLAEGALDVWTSPVVMKKGRPGLLLSILVASEGAPGSPDPEHFAQRAVALTGTLGIRRTDLERLAAEREVRSIDTPYGAVRVKVAPAGTASRLRPEADDVARIARENGAPFSVVERELTLLAAEQIGDSEPLD